MWLTISTQIITPPSCCCLFARTRKCVVSLQDQYFFSTPVRSTKSWAILVTEDNNMLHILFHVCSSLFYPQTLVSLISKGCLLAGVLSNFLLPWSFWKFCLLENCFWYLTGFLAYNFPDFAQIRYMQSHSSKLNYRIVVSILQITSYMVALWRTDFVTISRGEEFFPPSLTILSITKARPIVTKSRAAICMVKLGKQNLR